MPPVTFLYPGTVVDRRLPVNLEPADRGLFAGEASRTFPDVSASNLRRVRVYADGYCEQAAGSIPRPVLLFTDASPSIRQLIKAAFTVASRAVRRPEALRRVPVGRGLLLTDIYFSGFYHWFCDVLPKLSALRRLDVPLDEFEEIVPESRDGPYVAPTLAAYGMRARVIGKGEYADVEQLCFIRRLGPTGNCRPELIADVAGTIRRLVHAPRPGARLYISRAKAIKRRFVNEDAILPVLRDFGFQIACLEDLTFEEQLRLTCGCSVIAGLHGAGLTHILWMQPQGRVLEIRGEQGRRNNCYFSLDVERFERALRLLVER